MIFVILKVQNHTPHPVILQNHTRITGCLVPCDTQQDGETDSGPPIQNTWGGRLLKTRGELPQ